MPQHLQKSRKKLYAIMAVLNALHTYFDKAKFICSLETDSLSVAKHKVLTVVAKWKKQIETAIGINWIWSNHSTVKKQ